MIQAIENMNDFYKQKHIDFMHEAISHPGVAMIVCFNSITDPAAEFHLFNEKNRDIYQLFKQNIVGGPSIILINTTRLVKPSFKTIHTNLVKKIISYDANALYLWAIGQKLGVGFPLVR